MPLWHHQGSDTTSTVISTKSTSSVRATLPPTPKARNCPQSCSKLAMDRSRVVWSRSQLVLLPTEALVVTATPTAQESDGPIMLLLRSQPATLRIRSLRHLPELERKVHGSL